MEDAAVEGGTTGILLWIVAGLLVGALAKWLVPGPDPGGVLATMALGIAGAFLGGVGASALGLGGVTGWNLESLVFATLGAAVLLLATRALFRRG